KSGRVALPPGVQGEHRAAEVDPVDLGWIEGRDAPLIADGPEPDATAGPGPPGSARALIGRGATDPADAPAVDPSVRSRDHHPRQAAIDHRGHPVDRQGGLREVRAQDDLAAIARS